MTKNNPLDNLIINGGMMNVFRNICVIGDSLSSGTFECKGSETENVCYDNYEYSWPSQIQRITGINISNASCCGQTAYKLYKEADEHKGWRSEINNLFNVANKYQAYIIALGVNDLYATDYFDSVYKNNLGDVDKDVDLQDYNNNSQTFAGCYAKIIQRLKTIEPDSKFFLVTIPKGLGGSPEFTGCLENMCKTFTNCYLIDLFKYAPEFDDEFRKKYFIGGHMNASGYLLIAYYIMTYIDWIIKNNIMDFRDIHFIGSGKDKPLYY